MAFDYNGYFKNFAQVHRDILHDDNTNKVFHSDIDSIDERNMPQGKMYMFVPDPGVRFGGSTPDSATTRNFGEIYFCQACPNNDPIAEKQARDKAMRIAKQLVARLLKTRSNFEITDFNLQETTIDPAGPLLVSANAHGAVVRLYLGNHESLVIDNTQFTDLS